LKFPTAAAATPPLTAATPWNFISQVIREIPSESDFLRIGISPSWHDFSPAPARGFGNEAGLPVGPLALRVPTLQERYDRQAHRSSSNGVELRAVARSRAKFGSHDCAGLADLSGKRSKPTTPTPSCESWFHTAQETRAQGSISTGFFLQHPVVSNPPWHVPRGAVDRQRDPSCLETIPSSPLLQACWNSALGRCKPSVESMDLARPRRVCRLHNIDQKSNCAASSTGQTATIERGRVACGVCLFARPKRSGRRGRSAPRLLGGWRCLLHLNAGFGPPTVKG
jgi:hypothetical protein